MPLGSTDHASTTMYPFNFLCSVYAPLSAIFLNVYSFILVRMVYCVVYFVHYRSMKCMPCYACMYCSLSLTVEVNNTLGGVWSPSRVVRDKFSGEEGSTKERKALREELGHCLESLEGSSAEKEEALNKKSRGGRGRAEIAM